MRVIAYIDAFNFYYGLTKFSKYKWCNLHELCRLLLPEHDVLQTKLFVSYSKGFQDLRQPIRQTAYITALETVKQIQVIRSTFLVDEKYLPLISTGEMVKVKVPKEKGSDVKLATHLLMDAYKDNYDIAAVLSNDSDLEEPIRMVRKELNKKVALFAPIRHPNRRISDRLMRVASSHKIIQEDLLERCQFPDKLPRDGMKPIVKPREWY